MAVKYQVIVAHEARDELRKELAYIRRNHSVQQAKRVNKKIQEVIRSLATFPERHQQLEEIGTEERI